MPIMSKEELDALPDIPVGSGVNPSKVKLGKPSGSSKGVLNPKVPVTIDLRAKSMFQRQPDGTVHVTISPVRYIKPDDRILIDNPFRGIGLLKSSRRPDGNER